MTPSTLKFHQSARLERNSDTKQRLEKKLNDENSFNISVNNTREMITYLKVKNRKSKDNFERNETMTTILKSFDTFLLLATASTSITLSLTGCEILDIPISTATAIGSTTSNSVIHEIGMQKCYMHKKR